VDGQPCAGRGWGSRSGLASAAKKATALQASTRHANNVEAHDVPYQPLAAKNLSEHFAAQTGVI
jgi:hypothetical protein